MANANNNTQPDALTGLIDATQLQDILSVYAAAIKANKTSLGDMVVVTDQTEYPDLF